MTSALWGAFGTALTGLLFLVVDWLKQQQAQKTGAQIADGAVSAASATTETAIAQAVANAPTTQQGVVDSLNAGKF